MTGFLLHTAFPTVVNMSLTAVPVILAVLLARLPLKRTPKIFSYLLWGVVLFRLLCPVSLPSSFSLLGALDAPVQPAAAMVSTVDYVRPASPQPIEEVESASAPPAPSAVETAPLPPEPLPLEPPAPEVSVTAAEVLPWIWAAGLFLWWHTAQAPSCVCAAG